MRLLTLAARNLLRNRRRTATAQRLLRMEGRVTEYALAVARLEDAPRVRDAGRAALAPRTTRGRWRTRGGRCTSRTGRG